MSSSGTATVVSSVYRAGVVVVYAASHVGHGGTRMLIEQVCFGVLVVAFLQRVPMWLSRSAARLKPGVGRGVASVLPLSLAVGVFWLPPLAAVLSLRVAHHNCGRFVCWRVLRLVWCFWAGLFLHGGWGNLARACSLWCTVMSFGFRFVRCAGNGVGTCVVRGVSQWFVAVWHTWGTRAKHIVMFCNSQSLNLTSGLMEASGTIPTMPKIPCAEALVQKHIRNACSVPP